MACKKLRWLFAIIAFSFFYSSLSLIVSNVETNVPYLLDFASYLTSNRPSNRALPLKSVVNHSVFKQESSKIDLVSLNEANRTKLQETCQNFLLSENLDAFKIQLVNQLPFLQTELHWQPFNKISLFSVNWHFVLPANLRPTKISTSQQRVTTSLLFASAITKTDANSIINFLKTHLIIGLSWLFFLTVLMVFYLKIKRYQKNLKEIYLALQKYLPDSKESKLPLQKNLSQKSSQIIESLRRLRQQQVETEQKYLETAGQARTTAEKLEELQLLLQETQQLNEILWQSPSQALALIDSENRFVQMNQTFCDLVHLQKRELLGHSFSSIFPAQQKELLMNKFLAQDQEFHDQKVKLWFGQSRWWKVAIQVLNSLKTGPQKLIIIEDITHWMRKINELAQREKHFQLLFNKANDPVFVNQLTSDHRFGPFIEVNQKAIDTYLYSREEFRYLNPLTLIPSEFRHKHNEITQRLLKEKHVIYEIEYFRKDKRRIPVEINAHLFQYDDQPTVLSIVRDISERKRAQQALKQSSLQLRSLASRLQDIREEERTMVAREIHDELGQLLTVLKIEIALLCKQFDIKNPQVNQKVAVISDLINQAVQTIQQITSKLRPGILDEVGLVAALEWQAEEFSKHTGISCKIHLPKEEIQLDRERATAIFRIFQEALTNVARHSQAKRVSIFLKHVNQKVILEVIDNGQGINRQQIESPQSLGLLGMRERAMIFGGHLEIHGVPGQGTRVKVELPLRSE